MFCEDGGKRESNNRAKEGWGKDEGVSKTR
jgi:hypothetical protein